MYDYANMRYRLRLSDFDLEKRITPCAVLDLFTDLATVQAEDMGMGLADVRAKGLMWAVIREKYEVVRAPELHQEVMVATWPHTPSRFSFMRDYELRSLDGALLVRATSEWVLMDFVERTFASVKDSYGGPTDFREERCFKKKPRKLHDFDPVGEGAIVVPTWSDLDVNGHVNNAKYANFVMDHVQLPAGQAIRSFQMDFRKEVMRGEPVHLHVLREDSANAAGVGAAGGAGGADAAGGAAASSAAEAAGGASVVRAKGLDDEGTILFACQMELTNL